MNLIIRADASARMGIGHVMRCLALGQAWQGIGGQATMVLAPGVPHLEEQLRAAGLEVVHLTAPPGSAADASQTAHLAKQRGSEWVVVDGYHFGVDYQRLIKDAGLRLLFIDDTGHAAHYWADLVLNQNLHAHEDLYADREPYTRLLLGSRYVLLRREFRKFRDWQRLIPAVARRVLVTLGGGGEAANLTWPVVKALGQVELEGLEAVVVMGSANAQEAELGAASRSLPISVRLEKNVAHMADLMAWADLAVTAGGSTCWEAAFMGLPSLVVVLAENQEPLAQALQAQEVAINLGWHHQVQIEEIAQTVTRLRESQSLRERMSRKGKGLVDGEGVERVVMALKGDPIRLRPVRDEDCRLLWEWANDTEVRRFSFSQEHIPWEGHIRWFAEKRRDPNCFNFIALDVEDRPVGQVRFDITDAREAEIDVSVEKSRRGAGLGAAIIKMATEQTLVNAGIHAVNANVKPENVRSIRTFEKAGYKNLGQVSYKENPATHLRFSTSDP